MEDNTNTCETPIESFELSREFYESELKGVVGVTWNTISSIINKRRKAKAIIRLSEYLLSIRENILKIEMSEYQEAVTWSNGMPICKAFYFKMAQELADRGVVNLEAFYE